MKVRGDIERVNLSTGQRYQRVSGDGESRLEEVSRILEQARKTVEPIVKREREGEFPGDVLRYAPRLRKNRMHYSNGRAAKAGDIVRGKGYNIKHEIVGLLIFANPASSSCNCQVACVTKNSTVLINAAPAPEPDPNGALFFQQFNPTSMGNVLATIEYGQLDAFVAIDPATGEVLPAE